MKKQWILAALTALMCFAACSQDEDDKASVPVQIPDEIKEYGGQGNLLYGDDEETTGHTYTWSAKETAIIVNVNINTDEADERGDWEMGHFELPAAQINEFLGAFVGSEIDESTFYALEPDGSQVPEMTSYKPGMWINADSHSGNWSSGVFYWQWYVWGGKTDMNGNEIGYDYDYNECPGRFMIGTNPGNLPTAAGTTVTSKNVIVVGEQKFDFIVNVRFTAAGEEVPDYIGSGNLKIFDEDDNENVIETETSHTYTYKCLKQAITVDIDINSAEAQEVGSWEMGHFILPLDDMNEFLGTDVANLDETTFVSYEPDGTEVEEMTSYKPGMWLDENSKSSNWSAGACFWQWYVWGGKTDKNGNTIGYDYDHKKYAGCLYIGTNPGNIWKAAGSTITSKNVITVGDNQYDFIININFSALEGEDAGPKLDDDTPGAKTPSGSAQMKSAEDFETLLPHTFEWNVSADGIDITATMSLAAIDPEAWGIAYFKLDPEVINSVTGKDIANLELDEFYPVDADGAPCDWTSYKPGMWLGIDGNPYLWDGTPGAFWQYHVWAESKNEYYDFAAPGAFLIGQCPGTVNAGDTFVSKAVICGIPMTITIQFAE